MGQESTLQKDILKSNKLRSTTFWLTSITLALNPIAWWYDTYRTMKFLQFMVQNDIQPAQASFIFTSLPLTTLATASLAAVGLYIGGNKGRNIAQNLKTPPPMP